MLDRRQNLLVCELVAGELVGRMPTQEGFDLDGGNVLPPTLSMSLSLPWNTRQSVSVRLYKSPV